MFSRFIITTGLAAALALVLQAQAKAETVWIGPSAGAHASPWGVEARPMRITRDYGSPGWQRPVVIETAWALTAPGPGRHRVCGWQDLYDRHEAYAGSRRICWVEAR